ncbi:hypothetical protein INR49_011562 [Caranx melampygus]|nr:hypothetical protein INR49_011562 [Caranx melampygus]
MAHLVTREMWESLVRLESLDWKVPRKDRSRWSSRITWQAGSEGLRGIPGPVVIVSERVKSCDKRVRAQEDKTRESKVYLDSRPRRTSWTHGPPGLPGLKGDSGVKGEKVSSSSICTRQPGLIGLIGPQASKEKRLTEASWSSRVVRSQRRQRIAGTSGPRSPGSSWITCKPLLIISTSTAWSNWTKGKSLVYQAPGPPGPPGDVIHPLPIVAPIKGRTRRNIDASQMWMMQPWTPTTRTTDDGMEEIFGSLNSLNWRSSR